MSFDTNLFWKTFHCVSEWLWSTTKNCCSIIRKIELQNDTTWKLCKHYLSFGTDNREQTPIKVSQNSLDIFFALSTGSGIGVTSGICWYLDSWTWKNHDEELIMLALSKMSCLGMFCPKLVLSMCVFVQSSFYSIKLQ